MELGRRGNGRDIGIKGEEEECITREDKGGRISQERGMVREGEEGLSHKVSKQN